MGSPRSFSSLEFHLQSMGHWLLREGWEVSVVQLCPLPGLPWLGSASVGTLGTCLCLPSDPGTPWSLGKLAQEKRPTDTVARAFSTSASTAGASRTAFAL